MSVLEVRTESINAIVSLARGFIVEQTRLGTGYQDAKRADELGAQLIRMNLESYAQQYGGTVDPMPFRWQVVKPSRVVAIKALQSWLYNVDDRDNETYQQMHELLRVAALEHVEQTPEYNQASWG